MQWRACGFRISQLNETVVLGKESAAILQPEAIQGFTAAGEYNYIDFATAEVAYTSGGEAYWKITRANPIPRELRDYLVNELKFNTFWLTASWAIFPLEEYEPASDFAGEKMHFGFRYRVANCNSLTVTNGAAETNPSGTVAYRPWWREAFFGYTLPARIFFNFYATGDSRMEDLGTWQHVNGDDLEGWEHYPGLIPPRQATNEPGNTSLEGDCFVLTGGECYYPKRNNPSGWDASTEVRTVTGWDGKTYAYLWTSPDPYGFRWAEVVDTTIPFTFDDDIETEPEILIEANRVRIDNLRSIRTFRITADLAGIEAANQWTPTEVQWDIIHDAVRAAENGGEMRDFDARIGQEFVLGGYVFGTNLKVLPSSTFYEQRIVDLPNGDWFDNLTEQTITREQLVTEERIEIHSTAADIHHRVSIDAICEWERTDKHEINFTEASLIDYMTVPLLFPGKDDRELPRNSTTGARAFVETYGQGANPDNPGSFQGEIVADSTGIEDYYWDGAGANGCDRSWEIVRSKTSDAT